MKKIFKKTLSVILTCNLLLQSYAPFLIRPVYADDATSSANPATVTPTPDVTPTPTEAISPTPEITAEPTTTTPTVEPTLTATPTADVALEPSPAVASDSAVIPTIVVSPTVETTPISVIASDSAAIQDNESSSPPANNETSIVIPGTDPESIQITPLLSLPDFTTSSNLEQSLSPEPKLTTDKADYFPTDIAHISGIGFLPKTTYTLHIMSSDMPYVSYKADVTSDTIGTFTYAYQLDGNYRPNYKVDAIDANGKVMASMSFLDSASSGTIADADGVNDEPGQKDLTQLTYDYTGLPSSMSLTWNWDEIGWSGSNTGDACSLFDTDTDGYANYALCVSVSNTPAAYLSKALFSCDDSRSDRCPNSVSISTVSSSCSANVSSSDPFPTGDSNPNDTQASCNVTMSDVGGTSSKIIDVCSFPSQQPNSDPSDCIVASTQSQTGFLEIKKALSPSSDSGLFDLQIDGVTYAFDATHNSTTAEKVVDAASHTFGESQGTGTLLSNYTASVLCKDGNGTGSTVATSGTNPWTLTVGNNKDVVCTITNTRQSGTLTVQKVTYPAGDSTSFSITATGSGTITGGGAGTITDSIDQVYTVTPGTYSVSETVPTGWTQTSNTCTDIVVSAGGNASCTITNTKNATLTVTKVVVNDNGGTKVVSDFPLFVGSTPVTSGVANTFSLGSHVVSETPDLGYVGTISGDCDANGNVTLAAGNNKTCTITNDDQPATLTVIKDVLNPNSGLADDTHSFSLTVGTQTDSAFGEGDNALFTLDAGIYTVTEGVDANYDFISVSEDYDTSAAGYQVHLNSGENKTITVTNKQKKAKIEVIKDVVKSDLSPVNDDHGFTVTLDSLLKPLSESTDAIYLVNPGTYSAVESADANYTEVSNSGSVTVGSNGSATIDIVNKQNPGTVSGFKFNADGSTPISGWTINLLNCSSDFTSCVAFATDTTDASGYYSFANLVSGTYQVLEVLQDGWTNLTSLFHNVTVTPGALLGDNNFTNFENIAISGQKYNDQNGSGTKDSGEVGLSGWTIQLLDTNDVVLASTTTDASGNYSFINLGYGTYRVREVLQSGWAQTSANPVDLVAVSGTDVTGINFGNQMRGSITIIKDALPDSAQDFEFTSRQLPTFILDNDDNATNSNTQTFSDLGSNTYSITEGAVAGWTLTGLTCIGDNDVVYDQANRTVTVTINNPGENITCTFTNTQYGSISGYKYEDENGDGDKDAGDIYLDNWTIKLYDSENNELQTSITGSGDLSTGQFKFVNLLPGVYSICEVSQDGWVQTDPSTGCRQRTVNAGSPSGGVLFGNFKKASIVVHKNVLGTNGVTDVTDNTSFTALLDGTNAKPISETTTATYDDLLPGTYTVSEATEPAGYSWISTTNSGVVSVTSGGEHHVYIVNKQNSASLRVIKRVVNDNGGSTLAGSFTMNVTGTNVSDDSFPGEEAGTLITLDAGSYSVDETDYPGYTKSIGENCSGTIDFGESVTCTITNDDTAPKLTLVKNVIKDNGGNEAPDDFKLTIGGNAVLSGVTQTLSANTAYAINETPLSSYSFISITGDRKCPSALGGTVTLAPGDDITCTINNDDIAPSVTLTKNVVGGSATAADFSLYIGGTSVVSGQTLVVDANKSYSIDEDGPSGYSFTSISGNTKCPAVLGGTVTLDEDEDLSCTITNTRDTGTIVVNKIIDIDGDLTTKDDQSAGENWQFDVDGTGLDTTDAAADSTDSEGTVSFSELKTGEYTIVETTQPGYDLFSATCGVRNGSFDQTDSVDGVSVSKDETTTCTFYNKPNGTIHGYKWSDVNGDGQSWEENKLSGWTIDLYKSNGEGYDLIDTTVTDSGEDHFGWYWFENLFPGQYKVCEVQKDGWTQTYPINANTGNCHTLTLPDGNSNGFEELVNSTTGPVYKFGNRLIDPILTLSRSNNAGVPLNPGSTYEHTITIKVTGNDISNLKLTDLLPKGVTFSGSYTVLNGSTDITGSISAPVYHSPGIWELGDFAEGDILTVKYLANISSDIQPGTYTDLTWAIGDNPYAEGQNVFATGENSEFVSDIFVGTDVEVVKDQSRSDDYGVEKKVEGQVLGASTDLPATGANELWLLVALLSLYFGYKLVKTSN